MSAANETAIVTCGGCLQKNRIDLGRSPEAAVCGKCRSPLALGRVVEVTDATYAREVDASSLPVVLDCWAPWCGPCRMVAPVLEELAAKLAGRVKFAKLNVDDNRATAGRYNISSIPTLLLLRGGQLAGRVVGAQPAPAIMAELKRVGFA